MLGNLKGLNFWERDRAETFKKWPFDQKSPCNVAKMAEAGFYWSGNDKETDTATCFACGKVLDGWEQNDDPWKEHIKHAPQCPFVKFNRPEAKLTVAEILELLEVIVKTSINKDFEGHKKQFNKLMEGYRKELGQL